MQPSRFAKLVRARAMGLFKEENITGFLLASLSKPSYAEARCSIARHLVRGCCVLVTETLTLSDSAHAGKAGRWSVGPLRCRRRRREIAFAPDSEQLRLLHCRGLYSSYTGSCTACFGLASSSRSSSSHSCFHICQDKPISSTPSIASKPEGTECASEWLQQATRTRCS